MEFASLLILAIVVEFVWEVLGNIYKNGQLDWNHIWTLVLGLVVAFSVELNLFELINIPIKYEIVGIIFSGVVISSGSNMVHELIKKLGGRE